MLKGLKGQDTGTPYEVRQFVTLVRACGLGIDTSVMLRKPSTHSECFRNALVTILDTVDVDTYASPKIRLLDNGDAFVVYLERKDTSFVSDLKEYYRNKKQKRETPEQGTHASREDAIHKTRHWTGLPNRPSASKRKMYDKARVLRIYGVVANSLIHHGEALVQFPQYTESRVVATIEMSIIIRRCILHIMSRTRDFRMRFDMKRQVLFIQSDAGGVDVPFPEYVFSEEPTYIDTRSRATYRRASCDKST